MAPLPLRANSSHRRPATSARRCVPPPRRSPRQSTGALGPLEGARNPRSDRCGLNPAAKIPLVGQSVRAIVQARKGPANRLPASFPRDRCAIVLAATLSRSVALLARSDIEAQRAIRIPMRFGEFPKARLTGFEPVTSGFVDGWRNRLTRNRQASLGPVSQRARWSGGREGGQRLCCSRIGSSVPTVRRGTPSYERSITHTHAFLAASEN